MTNPKTAQSNNKKETNPKKSAKKTQQSNPQQKPTPTLAQLPPIESPSDYPSLLETARSLTQSEAREELLECARYGESDAVRAILEVHSATTNTNGELLVNATDSSGNTALHKAAANGHVDTVSILLVNGAACSQNENGATPLHWAAGAGKNAVCKLLLDHFDASNYNKALDVLLKNSFGRSALTEAFASGDTETVGVLLNHDSAEEEKLIGGMKKEKVDADDDMVGVGDEKRKDEIVHEFDFRRGTEEVDDAAGEARSVLIRELVSI